MSVYVFHHAFGDALNLVAKVNADDLDTAFAYTNTISYPWYNLSEAPEAVAEKMKVYGIGTGEGEVTGYRSTSVGDFMVINGDAFIVDTFGFEPIRNGETYLIKVDLGAGAVDLPMTGYNLSKILNILIVEKVAS